jgi:hypothetical protein
MPWLGFFNKIAKSDLWIVLDHVENNPRDSSFWCRRVRVLSNGSPKWISIPLRKPTIPGLVGIPIYDMRINRDLQGNLSKCFQTISHAYAKAPHYAHLSRFVDEYFSSNDESLLECNMVFVTSIMQLLGINTKIVYSSSLSPRGQSNELLLDLLSKVGASTYLCGNGASGYQLDHMFADRGILLQPNSFHHPLYDQSATAQFVPGLSILDVISQGGLPKAMKWVLE